MQYPRAVGRGANEAGEYSDYEAVAYGGPVCHHGQPDINDENTQRIRDYCTPHGLGIVGELPYDETVTAALAQRVPLVEYHEGPVAQGLREAWVQLEQLLND